MPYFDVDRDKTELTVTAIMSQLDIVRFLHVIWKLSTTSAI